MTDGLRQPHSPTPEIELVIESASLIIRTDHVSLNLRELVVLVG